MEELLSAERRERVRADLQSADVLRMCQQEIPTCTAQRMEELLQRVAQTEAVADKNADMAGDQQRRQLLAELQHAIGVY